MITIHIIAVGKLKEKWMREGCDEYLKRMRMWSRVTITELEEHRLPATPSDAQIAEGLRREGERIIEKIPRGARIVVLCIEGHQLSSKALAAYVEKAAIDGEGALAFLIGGSFGLSEEVKVLASLRLSLSPMTFPHQLARLLLCEQLYRALSINGNGKYHK